MKTKLYTHHEALRKSKQLESKISRLRKHFARRHPALPEDDPIRLAHESEVANLGRRAAALKDFHDRQLTMF